MGGARHIKGVNLIGLVKFLRMRRRKHPLAGLSPDLAKLLDGNILLSSWYPLEQLWGLLDYTYDTVLKRSERAALAMGVAGGDEIWSGPHRAYLTDGDPSYGLRYMSTAWSSYFDFGSCKFERLSAAAVRMTIEGVPDMPASHGMMIAGWHLAAARLTGWPDARVDVVERPWEGATVQVHEVHRT